MATTSTSWSVPGSSSSYAMRSPYLAGAEYWTATRASDSDKAVTITCNWGYGFGTNSITSSYTGNTVTATYSGGISKSVTISSGTWKRTGSKAIRLVSSGPTQTAYETIKRGSFSVTASNWTSGNSNITVTISQSGITTTHTITLACPAYNPTITCTIKYDKNGGSGTTMANTTYTYADTGTTTLRKNTYTRTGYKFIGWHNIESYADAGTVKYQDENGWNLNNKGDYTLYAVWEANSYTIKFNSNGGSGTMANLAMTYDKEKNLTANAFTRTGYSFLGWSTNSSATTATYTDKQSVSNLTSTRGGSVTLYAVWKVHSRTFTFNSNGGSGSMSDQSIPYDTSGTTALTANTFAKTYYTFTGWNTAANGTGTSYSDEQAIIRSGITSTSTVNLYAQWSVNTHTLTMYYATNNGLQTSTQTINETTTSTTPTIIDKTFGEYTFSGYFKEVSSAISSVSQIPTTDYLYDNYTDCITSLGRLTANKIIVAVYVRNTATTTTYTDFQYIRTDKPITSFPVNTTDWENNFLSQNFDTGQYISGYLKFTTNYPLSDTTIYHRLNGNTFKAIPPLVNPSISIQIDDEEPRTPNILGQYSITNGNIFYYGFSFSTHEFSPEDSWTLTITGSNLRNQFNREVGFNNISILIPPAYYIVDINKVGSMVAFGHAAEDDLGELPEYTVESQYVSNTWADVMAIPDTVVAINQEVYIADENKEWKPALTLGIIEDEVVLSDNTINLWKGILDGTGGGGSSTTILSLSVTQNGVYTAPSGSAYTPVTVAVSGGGGEFVYSDGILIIS